MQSLADFLGTNKPDPASAAPDAKTDFPSLLTMTGKVFAEAVLNSIEFRRYIVNGLTLGDLPPAVICRLIDHGWGKPVERVEVNTVNTLDDMTVEQLEDRALYLIELARHMRTQEGPAEESDPSESVH